MNKGGRHLDGFLLLDKPLEASSNQALQFVKRLFEAKKAGHTGSLDPLATGMLPICFGRATKFAGYLLDSDKCYRTTAKLGVKMTTGDAEGEVLETRSVPVLDDVMLEAAIAPFRGRISQIPPMYSALKHKGQPLYKLARQGITIEREPREVVIHSLDVLSVKADEIELLIRCTKGTYVRTLVEDIGEALGCGAHVSALRRDSVSPYENQPMYTRQTLEAIKAEESFAGLDRLILPIESALHHFPVHKVTTADKFYLKLGKPITLTEKEEAEPGFVRMFVGAEFIGLGEVENRQLSAKKIVE